MKIMRIMMIFLMFFSGCFENEPTYPVVNQVESVEEKKSSHQKKTPVKDVPSTLTYDLFFTDSENFRQGRDPFLKRVTRTAETLESPIQFVLDMLYKGPLPDENGIRLTTCQSTGAKLLSIESGAATVQLEGDCGGCGSHTIYDSISATVIQFPEISRVILLGPQGRTEDGLPHCLQP
jgi:hypothetical protein